MKNRWTPEQDNAASELVDRMWSESCDSNLSGTALDLACQRNELLEALKLAVERLSDNEDVPDEFTLPLREAIAKAESL